MGFHVCEWCRTSPPRSEEMQFSHLSSADVTISFSSGRTWQFPFAGLPHYVTYHGYLPPADFIDDVVNGTPEAGQFIQTKSLPMMVGYLQYPQMPEGVVPAGFIEKLTALVDWAKGQNGNMFSATRGVNPDMIPKG